ncbi:MAK10-like protein [Tanacetum coccineum]
MTYSKSPHYGIDLWLQVQIFYDHVNPATMRIINHSSGGKLRDKNAEESWALLADLALYDNESWNDPRDFTKPVKAISLPHDVLSTSDRRLIVLENQVQRLMEAHLAPKQPVQVNKIAFSCEICSGPHDTQYCMENPEQAFVEIGVYFMESQDARISKFEADFKQYQSEMNNKYDTLLKAVNDRVTGALLTDRVKNLKLNVNHTYSISSAHFYPMEDPQSSSHSFKSVNAIKTCFNLPTHFQKGQLQVKTLTVNEVETPKSKEPEKAIDKDLHLSLPVLKVLAHVPMYEALLDKYIQSLELGKKRSAFIHGKMPKKMKDPGLFILPCGLGDSNPFDTLSDLGSCVNLIPLNLFKKLRIRLLEETEDVIGLADGTKSYPVGIVKNVEVHVGKLKLVEDFHVVDMVKDPTCPLIVGRGFLATASAVIDCKKAKIAVGEEVTRSIFGVKEINFGEENTPYWTTIGKRKSYTSRTSIDGIGARPPYYAKKEFMYHHLPGEWEIARDVELNPFKDILVFRKMVEFLGTVIINLKRNMWESKDLIENKMVWNKPPKRGDGA